MIDRDTVIALAKQAGALRFSHPYRDEESDSWAASTDNIERFAKLIEQRAAEKEREACAAACEQLAGMAATKDSGAYWMRMDCASTIRARGTGGEG